MKIKLQTKISKSFFKNFGKTTMKSFFNAYSIHKKSYSIGKKKKKKTIYQ